MRIFIRAIIIYLILFFVITLCELRGENFKPSIRKSSKKYDIPQHIIYRVIQKESEWKKKVVNKGSGAVGLMQIRYCAFVQYCRDNQIPFYKRPYYAMLLFTGKFNIEVGTATLKWFIDYHNGDMVRALNSYNMGQRRTNNGNYNYNYICYVLRKSKFDVKYLLGDITIVQKVKFRIFKREN